MILTYQQAIDLHAGLAALDNKDGFQYGDTNTPYRIAITIKRLEAVPKAFTKARRKLYKDIFGDKVARNDDPRSTEFQEQVEDFLDSNLPEEIKVLTVTRDELKAKENGISGATLAKVAPMISDFGKDFDGQGV